MNTFGLLHILLLLAAYVLYLLTTLRSISGKVSYRILFAANAFYVFGFVLGMLWSKEAWGDYLIADPKIILSVLVPVPYVLENILRTRKWHLPVLGAALMMVNYVLPQVLATVHSH